MPARADASQPDSDVETYNGSGGSDSESDSEAQAMDLQDDDLPNVTKKSSKKPKPGVLKRDEIRAERTAIEAEQAVQEHLHERCRNGRSFRLY